MTSVPVGWEFEGVVDEELDRLVPDDDKRRILSSALRSCMVENYEAAQEIRDVDVEAVRAAMPAVLEVVYSAAISGPDERELTEQHVLEVVNGLCSPEQRLPFPFCPA